ncbi:hypothetical protein [Romboutsia sp.]|uniref:Ig-like domain-containing protein n=1 Tax=Romboutsia sp. TaxID=1965302 RepID=UPI003F401F53
MSNLFEGFEIESITQEKVIDKNPDIYVTRSEQALKDKRFRNAIDEINDAVMYAEEKTHYMLEKIKILNACSYYGQVYREECIDYIVENIVHFYECLKIEDFLQDIIQKYEECFSSGKSNIVNVLKKNDIPYTLGYKCYEDTINTEKVLIEANKSYKNKKYIDALHHTYIIIDKLTPNINTYMLAGDSLRKLKKYDSAINAYKSAIRLMPIYLPAFLRIVTTKLRKHLLGVLTIILILLLIFIGSISLSIQGVIPPIIKDYSVKISNSLVLDEKNDSIFIPINKTMEIDVNYKAIPFYAKKVDFSYSIEDQNIAKITEDGMISTFNSGTTNLNILRNNRIVYTIPITVLSSKVESISIDIKWDELQVGDEAIITAQVDREYDIGQGNKITYKSSDESILQIGEDGNVRAVGLGRAAIIAECDGNETKKYITVNPKVIDLVVDENIEIAVDEVYNLKTFIETNPPGYGNLENVKYQLGKPDVAYPSDSNQNVIDVDNQGNIKGISVGEQNLIVMYDDIHKVVKVTVRNKTINDVSIKKLQLNHEINGNVLKIYFDFESTIINEPYYYRVYQKIGNSSGFVPVGEVDAKYGEENRIVGTFDLSQLSGKGSIEFYIVPFSNQIEGNKSEVVKINI